MTTQPQSEMSDEKARASAWFRSVRDDIVAAFEAVEDSQTEGPFAHLPAGRFEVTETKRASTDGSDAGGGLMSVMRGGRVFEKKSALMFRRCLASLVNAPRMRWRPAKAFRAWRMTRAFGRRGFRSWRICKTRTRLRFI